MPRAGRPEYTLVFGSALIDGERRKGIAVVPPEPAPTIHFFELRPDSGADSRERTPGRALPHASIPSADFTAESVVTPTEVVLKEGMSAMLYSFALPDGSRIEMLNDDDA